MDNNLETTSRDLDIEVTSMKESIYKIGDLAREFDVSLRTLRFYEDRGLVKPDRMGTTRLYSAEDRERLQVALFCKRIGLSLGEIRNVLDLHDTHENPESTEQQIRSIYRSQLSILEKQQEETRLTIANLQEKLNSLSVLD